MQNTKLIVHQTSESLKNYLELSTPMIHCLFWENLKLPQTILCSNKLHSTLTLLCNLAKTLKTCCSVSRLYEPYWGVFQSSRPERIVGALSRSDTRYNTCATQ